MTVLIDTERLQMRHFTLADLEAVYAFSSHEEVTRYTGDAGMVRSRDDARRIIEEVWLAEYQRYGYARYALVHKGDNRVIGFCGMKYETHIGATDIGYRMLPQYWGQGLAKEAVAALLPYARDVLGLKRIVGDVVDVNLASARLLQRAGFKQIDQFEDQGFTLLRFELNL
ncbi:GNAT family N-acetyltransferase [Ferrimonas sp. SCSIO 43195]|uniref:GNAT family N-acetyltransferase n=1 Tax=Ferrimonas sp. SCSIO 43195 TaxID=2822844 RepID=UPI002074E0B6|nr:GNAT family N-acetyltransferase [Ferrimonas sp. SCSIO 43195]USD37003.1 GNAT family N-acetyltransferase [Ferrimonas sp. SCSIO 43195]